LLLRTLLNAECLAGGYVWLGKVSYVLLSTSLFVKKKTLFGFILFYKLSIEARVLIFDNIILKNSL
jgi:hypothetical protein